MSTSEAETDSRARDVLVRDAEFEVCLADGRRIVVPLTWFPRLAGGTPPQRDNWELIGDGEGIHWPDLDEDLSVIGLMRVSHSRPA